MSCVSCLEITYQIDHVLCHCRPLGATSTQQRHCHPSIAGASCRATWFRGLPVSACPPSRTSAWHVQVQPQHTDPARALQPLWAEAPKPPGNPAEVRERIQTGTTSCSAQWLQHVHHLLVVTGFFRNRSAEWPSCESPLPRQPPPPAPSHCLLCSRCRMTIKVHAGHHGALSP